MATFKVITDFSRTPGPRRKVAGKYSGEELRGLLFDRISGLSDGEVLTVDLDGTYGYAASFLEEVFGGLIRECGCTYEMLQKSMKLVSAENPEYLREIDGFLRDAEERERSLYGR